MTKNQPPSIGTSPRRRLTRQVATASLLLAAGLAAGCGKAESEPRPTDAIKLTVAPLSLPDVRDARYWIIVRNAAGETVIDKRDITASRFGNNAGAISYVAPCDTSGTGMNTVTIVLEDIFEIAPTTNPIDRATWMNPCGFAGDSTTGGEPVNWDGFACSQTVKCEENADVPVTFNLVVVRDAKQGFFDIGVNFDNIFCSAKVDCIDEFLHNPGNNDERDLTAIVAFACTAGNDRPTNLYMNDIRIQCSNPAATYYFNPSQGEGQHGPIPAAAATPALFQTASYFGREGFQNMNKCFWNHAIGLNLAQLGGNCNLHVRATASSEPFGNPSFTTPPNTVWPVIDYTVRLTDMAGNLVCQAHPLNESSGVETVYATTTERFTHRMECGSEPTPVDEGRTLCTSNLLGSGADMTFTQTGSGVVVRVGDTITSQTFPLAAGLNIDNCCGNPCCQ